VGGDDERVAALSGPNHAEEIAAGIPAATVVAATSAELCRRLQAAFSTSRFRVYANTDLVGVELCAAAKNVIAIAAGASDGLGYGDNAKAALMTRGLAEMARLGAAFGADPRTFAGLAGLGDLVATCCSPHSRNRRAGLLLARGVPPAELEQRIGMVVEGVATAPTLQRIGRERGLDLPLTERVCAALEGEAPAAAVELLLAREPGEEF
jgi:glycerol-3-phosphate dehydrogenase (NAD(P)+)